jgi:hypothetical protein
MFHRGLYMSVDVASMDSLKSKMNNFVNQIKESFGEVKSVAAAQAWKILQLAVAETVQIIEENCKTLSGPDKKAIAMEYLSNFYDTVFDVVVVPGVPSILQSLIKRYTKVFLMALVSSSIDAMVTTFRQVGVFSASIKISSQSIKPKVKRTRKKK